MLITTDPKRALEDPGNRAAARAQIMQSDAELFAECDLEDREQWIDDIIRDWCIELRHDQERGFEPS